MLAITFFVSLIFLIETTRLFLNGWEWGNCVHEPLTISTAIGSVVLWTIMWFI